MDAFRIYAMYRINEIPLWVVRLCHQLYLLFLSAVTICIYGYITCMLGKERNLSPLEIIIMTFFALISLICVLCGKLTFYSNENGMYAGGSMIYSAYILNLAYFTFIAIKVMLAKKSSIIYSRRIIIFIALLIMGIISGFQYFLKTITLTTLGFTITILLLYLSLEDPAELEDSYTGAYNSKAFRLVLHDKTNRRRGFFIINIDIENFEEIEKNYGAELDEHFMKRFVKRLEDKYKRRVYRINQHSFSIIVDNAYRDFDDRKPESKKIGQKKYSAGPMNEKSVMNFIAELNRFLEKKWEMDKKIINFHGHIDLISYPKDVNGTKNISELISIIEDCHEFSTDTGFVRRMNRESWETFNRQKKIVALVTDAIKSEKIEMFFQPIYNIKKGKFTNAEALVRLSETKDLGYISPEEFIPLAEKNGLIEELSNHIFSKVFKFISDEKLMDRGVEFIEVNLSALQSVQSNLPDFVLNLLNEHKIPSSMINLEITESMALEAGFMLEKNMSSLKRIGCTFSMDDFGTGYSNLSQMAKIEYELVKLDKSLLWPCFDSNLTEAERKSSKIVLENMVNMILKLNRKIVVEGVETEEQFNYMKALGVNFIQGYYFSKPLSMSEYLAFLQEKNN
ncbi:MAG: bifunctional diguanylate cyclase/phosphodiesterase [Treponemataceae bacterium]|nr:bifunctional diguanylate cyclase/phosphodiesterase [Treponemataceae bacterium]